MGDALAAAQAEIAALVRERRGSSCTQSLPFFVYRPRCKVAASTPTAAPTMATRSASTSAPPCSASRRATNFATSTTACNEGAPPRGSVAIAGCRSHGLRLLNVTTNASSPKVLAVGSTLHGARGRRCDRRRSQGYKGLGARPRECELRGCSTQARVRAAPRCGHVRERRRVGLQAHVPPVQRHARGSAADEPGCRPSTGAACGSRRARPADVRRAPPHQRHRRLPQRRRPGARLPPAAPSWAELRRRGRADAPAQLCVVPHFADRAVLEMHTATLQAARAERLRECARGPPRQRAAPSRGCASSTTPSRAAGSRSRWRARSRRPRPLVGAAWDHLRLCAARRACGSTRRTRAAASRRSRRSSTATTLRRRRRGPPRADGRGGAPLLDGGDLRRASLGRLLHFARRYVEAFPFNAVCDR